MRQRVKVRKGWLGHWYVYAEGALIARRLTWRAAYAYARAYAREYS